MAMLMAAEMHRAGNAVRCCAGSAIDGCVADIVAYLGGFFNDISYAYFYLRFGQMSPKCRHFGVFEGEYTLCCGADGKSKSLGNVVFPRL
jgi:hypothetical protein